MIQIKMSMNKRIIICFILLISGFCAMAHPLINYALKDTPASQIFGIYFKLGITHIIPNGFDHILFVVSLCLLSNNIKTILWQASAFTVAHSITLALSIKGILVAPAPVVEPIIALSIVFVAVENILLSELKAWRILIVFFFGLVHGLGFASALSQVGIPPDNFLTTVLSFNIGVEIGQVLVIILIFGIIIFPLGKKENYRKFVVNPISACIALTAIYWTIERIVSM